MSIVAIPIYYFSWNIKAEYFFILNQYITIIKNKAVVDTTALQN